MDFASGSVKPLLDKAPGRQIEFAHHHRVAAAARQRNEAARERSRTIGTLEYPVFVFAGGEAIDVEQRLPMGGGIRVIGDSRAPPNAFGMPGVLPEIEHIFMVEVAEGDAILGVEDRKNGVEIGVIVGIGGQDAQGLGVFLLDPSDRFFAMDVFQPKIGIAHALCSSCLPAKSQRCRNPDRNPDPVSHESSCQRRRVFVGEQGKRVKAAAGTAARARL